MEHVITSFIMPYATGSNLKDWPHTRPSCSVLQIIFQTFTHTDRETEREIDKEMKKTGRGR